MITTYLATVIGWYLVVVSLLLLCRYEHIKRVTKDIMAQPGQFFIVGIITLLLGLLLVTSHNIWLWGWPVVITVFSWLVLVGGLIRLYFPEKTLEMWSSFMGNAITARVVAIIIFLVGLFLLCHVYCKHWM